MARITNMPLWITADIILEKFIVNEWNPHFILIDNYTIKFEVCKNEDELLEAAPEEDVIKLRYLMENAKRKMLNELGFNINDFAHKAANKNTEIQITQDLIEKERVYEIKNEVSVRKMFLQMVLYSVWEMPHMEDVEIKIIYEQ